MTKSDSIHDVVASLYKATAGVEGFDAFLNQTSSLQNSNVVALIKIDHATRISTMPHYLGLSEEDFKDFNEGYAQDNEVINAFLSEMMRGEVISSSDKITDLQISRTAYYADYLQRIDVTYLSGALVLANPHETTLVVANRSKTCGPYSALEKRNLDIIRFHLNSALNVGSLIEDLITDNQAKTSALEQLNLGVCLIGEHLTIDYANTAAQQVLEHGKLLCSSRGRLRSGFHSDREISRLLFGMHARKLDSSKFIRMRSSEHEVPSFIAVFPIQSHEFVDFWLPSPTTRYVMFFGAQDILTETCISHLTTELHLTFKEIELVSQMMQCKDLILAAAMQGITHETARSHIKRVFQKLGVHSQAELMIYVSKFNSIN